MSSSNVFFHNMKKQLFTSSKVGSVEVDEFGGQVKEFKDYREQVVELQQNVGRASILMTSLATQSASINARLCTDLKVSLPLTYTKTSIDIEFIKDEVAIHDQLQARLDKRLEYKKELDYYAEKIALMAKDREYRASRKRLESQADEDKWNRNQNKFTSWRLKFEESTAALLKDLTLLLGRRHSFLLRCSNEWWMFQAAWRDSYNALIPNLIFEQEGKSDPIVPSQAIRVVSVEAIYDGETVKGAAQAETIYDTE